MGAGAHVVFIYSASQVRLAVILRKCTEWHADNVYTGRQRQQCITWYPLHPLWEGGQQVSATKDAQLRHGHLPLLICSARSVWIIWPTWLISCACRYITSRSFCLAFQCGDQSWRHGTCFAMVIYWDMFKWPEPGSEFKEAGVFTSQSQLFSNYNYLLVIKVDWNCSSRLHLNGGGGSRVASGGAGWEVAPLNSSKVAPLSYF